MASAKTTRRALLGTGAVLVAAAAATRIAGVDDDALRAIGVRPHPEPDPADDSLLASAVSRQQQLAADLSALVEDEPTLQRRTRTVRTAVDQQLRTLGGKTASTTSDPPSTLDELARRFSSAADASTAAAIKATSPDLARVLASLGAGQAQLARALGRMA